LRYGYKKEELIGKSLLEFIPEKHWPMISEHLEDLAKGKSTQGEVELKTKQGIVIAEFRSSPIKKREKIVGFQSIVRDITQQKLMEEELRESEEKYRLIFENSPDGIITLDPMGNITSVNDVVLSYGYKREELVGKSLLDFVPFVPEKHRPILDKHVASVTSGKFAQGEMELNTPKGRLSMWFRASPIKKRGEIVGFQLILIDITKRRKAEETLKESERKLRDVIENSPDAVVWVDTTGKITLVNKKGFELTGWSEQDLIGKNFMDVEALTQESKEKILEGFMKRIEGIDTPPYEVEIVTKNGEIIPAELSASLIFEGGKIVGTQSILRDLRERKRVEERLRESEERLRILIEYAPDGIFLYDSMGRFIDGNKQAEEMTGYKKEELIGRNFLTAGLLPEKYVRKSVEVLAMNRSGQKTGPLELELIRKDGTTIPVEISTFPVEREGKLEVIGIARDITEHKNMEEKFRESEERLRNLYESVPDALAVYVGREGHLIEYNKAFKKAYGYTDEELKGKTFLDFVHPDYHAMLIEEYRKEHPEEELPFVCEINGINKKGDPFPIEISVGPYRKKGRVIGIEVIHRDISERKRAEEALRRSEEQARRLSEFQNKVIDTADVWVDLLDKEGNITLWNRAAELISGYSREEVIGHKKIWEWLYPDPKYRAKIFAQAKKIIEKRGRAANDETTIRCKDGTLKIIRWYDNSILDEKGKSVGSLAVGIDITEKKTMERKLQEYAEHLEEMVEERTRELKESQERLIKAERLAAIGQLATMVGHDLRNPLSSIQNACYYLKMKLGASKDKKLRKMFEIIDKEINYTNKIINDLLDFSKVKKPELKKIDVISSIRDALTQLKFPEKITLTTKFSEVPTIEADPDQLRRVFQNIALNGIQAMPNDGKLTVSTRKNGGFVEVAFTDTGIGIPEENMDKLFIPLFTTKAQGVGLGLPICKNLVEGHNGRIEVKSKVGEGSTFTVKLPIHQSKGGEK